MFSGRTDAKGETPIIWPPHVKSWLIGKDCDAGRDWGQEEKGPTEDEMAGWHHRLGGCEFEWTLGVGDGQGGLACCNSWGHKESYTTKRLNWTELNVLLYWLNVILVITFSLLCHIASCEYITISCHFCYILQLQEQFSSFLQLYWVILYILVHCAWLSAWYKPRSVTSNC